VDAELSAIVERLDAINATLNQLVETIAAPPSPPAVGASAPAAQAPDGGERLLTTKEIADRLGKSDKWVYTATERHGMPHVKVGARNFYLFSAVWKWLNRERAGDWSADEENR